MRRFFAFLALLTGLAAVGAPANAVLLGGAAQQIASADAAQAESKKAGECREDRRNISDRTNTRKGCKLRKPITVYVPAVYFGADRAFE